MLSFLSSLFYDSENSKKSYITNTLKVLNKPYTNVSNGINIDFKSTDNINEVTTVTIPTNFRETLNIYIKKNLKDTNGDYINCFYVYKFDNNLLNFINRIKIIDLETIKVDTNNERIPETILSKITTILNTINQNINYKKIDLTGGSESNDDDENNMTITKSDVQDFRYLKYKSKYNNLKKIMNTSITESESSSDSSN